MTIHPLFGFHGVTRKLNFALAVALSLSSALAYAVPDEADPSANCGDTVIASGATHEATSDIQMFRLPPLHASGARDLHWTRGGQDRLLLAARTSATHIEVFAPADSQFAIKNFHTYGDLTRLAWVSGELGPELMAGDMSGHFMRFSLAQPEYSRASYQGAVANILPVRVPRWGLDPLEHADEPLIYSTGVISEVRIMPVGKDKPPRNLRLGEPIIDLRSEYTSTGRLQLAVSLPHSLQIFAIDDNGEVLIDSYLTTTPVTEFTWSHDDAGQTLLSFIDNQILYAVVPGRGDQPMKHRVPVGARFASVRARVPSPRVLHLVTTKGRPSQLLTIQNQTITEMPLPEGDAHHLLVTASGVPVLSQSLNTGDLGRFWSLITLDGTNRVLERVKLETDEQILDLGYVHADPATTRIALSTSLEIRDLFLVTHEPTPATP